jgi:serine/threonine protein kinase
MGVVYKARDTHLDRFVALKLLPSEKVADPERKRRFAQEAGWVTCMGWGRLPDLFLAMDIAQGDYGPQILGRRSLEISAYIYQNRKIVYLGAAVLPDANEAG